jgi:hypothetical protein
MGHRLDPFLFLESTIVAVDAGWQNVFVLVIAVYNI